MASLRILYDGWSLCYEPESPAVLHLLAILAYLPETVEPIIAFPTTPPAWIPAGVKVHVEPALPQHLRWEQNILPKLRKKLDADLLHLTTETASLWQAKHTVISPTQSDDSDIGSGEPRTGLMTRLRGALAAGGAARAQALFWPDDLPASPGRTVISLPPIVHPDFMPDEGVQTLQIPGVEIPETFVLYHGPKDEASLQRALSAWTWAAGPIGQDFPLVMVGLGKMAQTTAEEIAQELNIRETLCPLSSLSPDWIAPLYRRAQLIFHPASAFPWGGAIRHGLACGKPVVAAETAWASAIVGPAAILVNPEDTRRLGASVIGCIVKENLATQLREAAITRSARWRDRDWGEKLLMAYTRVLHNPHA